MCSDIKESKYGNELNQMVWSHSRLNSYEQCPYLFYLKYIQKDMRDLEEGSFYSELGTLMHEIIAAALGKQISLDEMPVKLIALYDERIIHHAKKSVMDKAFDECLSYLCEEDFWWLSGYDVVGIEKEVFFERNSIKYKAILDCVIRESKTGNIYIVDHKSSAYPLSDKTGTILRAHEQQHEEYKRQMYLYAHAVFSEYNQLPNGFVWNYFRKKKLLFEPFSLDEYKMNNQYTENLIKTIYDDEQFEDKQSYFYCSNLCVYRNQCEYRMIASQ